MIGLAVFWFGRKWLPADPKQQQQQPDAAPGPVRLGLCKTLADNKRRVSTILLVSVFTVVFWAVYEQQGNVSRIMLSLNMLSLIVLRNLLCVGSDASISDVTVIIDNLCCRQSNYLLRSTQTCCCCRE